MPSGIYIRSEEQKRKIGCTLKNKGIHPPSEFWFKKNDGHGKGRVFSESTKRKMSLSRKKYTGEQAPGWKGGITPINKLIRSSFKNDEWRKKIFVRDSYKCQICDKLGGKLNANHIKKFADYPELRFEISNGITLCEPCHQKKVNHHEEEFENFFNLPFVPLKTWVATKLELKILIFLL